MPHRQTPSPMKSARQEKYGAYWRLTKFLLWKIGVIIPLVTAWSLGRMNADETVPPWARVILWFFLFQMAVFSGYFSIASLRIKKLEPKD